MQILILSFIINNLFMQTDWMGGSGLQGPVTSWSTRYLSGDSITAATEGQVSLIATQWTYSNWVKHTIEANPTISGYFQGLMPADVDKDGLADCIACSDTLQVAWYKNLGGYTFQKNIIDNSASSSICWCTYPYDLDKDDDIDVLVAGKKGVFWYENQNPVWVCHIVDTSKGFHRIFATDVELDGDIDIIAVDNNDSYFYCGDIYLFRNPGNNQFTKDTIADFSVDESWRVYPADFNGDGYPDLYAVHRNVLIFLNDQTGHFSQSFSAIGGKNYDGAWAIDIDMDGDKDLVCGDADNGGFDTFLNDGTGFNFTRTLLAGTDTVKTGAYTDGGIAADIDLDSIPDIAGTCASVGFFRQSPGSPLNFSLYDISPASGSHWIYAAPMGPKCIPSVDLLVSNLGEHTVFENQMLTGFAKYGDIESSILQFSSQNRSLQWFGWETCLPDSGTLNFYWRADTIAGNVLSNAWNGPYTATNKIDSFALPANPHAQFFQYKVEFTPTITAPVDVAVLYKVWFTDTLPIAGIAENTPVKTQTKLLVSGDKILLSVERPINNADVSIYNSAGEKMTTLFKGTIANHKYEFKPTLKSKGVYLVVLSNKEGNKSSIIETTKFIKYK
ncbi:MAG: T9SS type A sorting domain-containing protein [bacterium]